jgi:polysaccharide biosynthesis/export protein
MGAWWALLGAVAFLVAGCQTSTLPKNVVETRETLNSHIIVESTIINVAEVFGEGWEEVRDAELPPAPVQPVAEYTGAYEYRIGAGDILDFRSFDDPLLSRQVAVRYDGFISLPLIPDLQVSGMTRAEAIGVLEQAYAEYFTDPFLSLAVVAVESKTYSVMGDISRPAIYPYTQPITLLDAINSAGGLRINTRAGDSFVASQGQLTKALIIRTTHDSREVLEFDLRGLQRPGPHSSQTPVYPGDVVYVPEGVNLVYLIGEVRRPEPYQMSENMTLLELMVRAGGAVDATARQRNVVLIHQLDESRTQVQVINFRKVLATGVSPRLHPGDVVYVPRKQTVRLHEFVNRITGTISPILQVYEQLYSAYYTRERWDQILNRGFDTSNPLALQQLLRDLDRLGGLVGGVVPAR